MCTGGESRPAVLSAICPNKKRAHNKIKIKHTKIFPHFSSKHKIYVNHKSILYNASYAVVV